MLNTEELVTLSRQIATTIDERLHVEGVMWADGGSGRAEILVSIGDGDHDSAHLLNIDRSERRHAEEELAAKLARVVAGPGR